VTPPKAPVPKPRPVPHHVAPTTHVTRTPPQTVQPRGTLPFTGARLWLAVVVGIGLLGLGSAARFAVRARRI
jgi:hypothetical protein